MFIRGLLFILLPFVVYFIPALVTISDYNVNWDEPIHFVRGQAYLRLYLTGKKTYDGITLPKHSIYQNEAFNGEHYLKNDEGHSAINGTLAALTNYILYQKLGIIGDIQSYHLFIISLSFFLVILVFWWSYKEYGLFAGIISLLAISLYPLFIAESHNNIKDPVQTTFFSLALFGIYIAIKNKDFKWILASSVFAGFALGTKLNVIFLPLIVIVWLLIRFFDKVIRLRFNDLGKIPRGFLISIFLYPFIVFSIFFAGWPYLWQNPIKNISKFLSFYRSLGINQSNSDSLFLGILNPYAIQWILFITPIVTLFFLLVGIFYFFLNIKREKERALAFWLVWFFIPIIRVSIPTAGIYGGVRQIMEYIPPLALLSGVGAQAIVTWLYSYMVKKTQISKLKSRAVAKAAMARRRQNQNLKLKINPALNLKLNFALYALRFALIFSFIPITLKLISIHPNQNLYFNESVGGLRGAAERNFRGWGTTLGNPYLQGVRWLNRYAEKDAVVTLAFGLMPNVPSIMFRDDIRYANNLKSATLRKGEYIMELAYYEFPFPYFDAVYPERYLIPVYEKKVDGVSVLKIWKNDEAHTKKGFINEQEITEASKIVLDEDGFTANLGIAYYITRVEIDINKNGCKPDSGSILTSLSGSFWQREPEGLLAEQFPIVKKFSEGKIKHFLASVPAKHIKVEIIHPQTCSIKNYKMKIFALADIKP